MSRRPDAVVAAVLLTLTAAGCTSEPEAARCPEVADPVARARIETVVRDVAAHRSRAIVSGAEASVPLTLSDGAIQVSPEMMSGEQRAYQVLSWSYARHGYVRFDVKDVRVEAASSCGSRMIAEVNGSTDIVHSGGTVTGSVFGPREFEFEVASDGRWTVRGHRSIGVTKIPPMIEPGTGTYAEFDRR